MIIGRADAVQDGRKQQRWMRHREHPLDSARSATPACRETPRARTGKPHERPMDPYCLPA
jgi:hypothetical protein